MCAIHAELTGRTTRHVAVPVDVFAARLVADGMLADDATFLADLDRLIASGAQAAVADTVQRLTGRPPRSVRDVLAEELAGGRCHTSRE